VGRFGVAVGAGVGVPVPGVGVGTPVPGVAVGTGTPLGPVDEAEEDVDLISPVSVAG
jgi:hypothetical protein